MDSPFTNLDFERFIYRQGQLLASRDYQDQQQMEAARRWMHNSALHNAWGVASGFEPSLSNNPADNKWGLNVNLNVTPGIAYDCFGRELVSPNPITLSRNHFEDGVGNLRGELAGKVFFLVLNYQHSDKPAAVTPCPGIGSNPKILSAYPPWKDKAEVQYGADVPLLSVSFASNGTTIEATIHALTVNRVRPQSRPKMASGQTVAGQTAWQFWKVANRSNSTALPDVLGLEVEIDTSFAGFRQQPCYFAWLNGPLQTEIARGAEIFSPPASFARATVSITPFSDSTKVPLVLSPFTSLANEKHDRFTFRVFMLPKIAPDLANRLPWTVCWVGIEG